MAAPIRVRVAELRSKFGNCPPLNEFVDPFWLLVSVKELPFIHDVGKRVLSVCINAISRQAKDDNDFEDCSSMLLALASDSDAGSGTSNAPCELWLDGCRLLDSERTDVLRDNDSISVTVLNYERKKRKRSKTADHDDLEFSNVRKKKKDKDGKKKKELVEVNCDDKLSNSTNKYLAQMNDILPPGMTRTLNVEEKAVHHKCSLDSFQFVSEIKPVNDKKKKKKKREKETSDFISEEKKRKPDLTVSFNDSVSALGAHEMGINPVSSDGIQSVSSPIMANFPEIELQKRKLLGQLDSFVQSGELLQVAENSGVCLKNSQDNDLDTTIGISLEKKRRRRRKKKSKSKEESKPILRVEDKPRSSVLNLPWDMQPQNRKITFDSDSDDFAQEDIVVDGAKSKVIDDKKVGTSEEDKKELSGKSNEDVKKNGKSSFELQSVSKRYKDLTPTCRKYLMRSTVGILDSLRTSNSTNNNRSFPLNSAVATKCHIESSSITPDINRPMGPTVDTAQTNEPALQSRIDDDAVINDESKSTFGENSNHQKSGIDSQGKFNHQQKDVSSPNSNFQKNNASYASPSKSVDYDAKFNELLQRRKLSSTQCSVSRSENGVTICSRNKSPKWNPYAQVNKFADPAADVLTNVSTVKKFSKKDESFNLQQKLVTSGRGFVKGTVNGGSGDAKVEVIPLDIENCPSLSGKPCMGDILAYKILEMDADYTPVVSDFKTGKVLSCEGGFIMLELFGSPASKKPKGKFDLVYDDDEEPMQDTQTAEQVNVNLASMMDTRLVQRYTENGT